jgi:ATPase subunit of ABC transporter with duplicated ATPase domains
MISVSNLAKSVGDDLLLANAFFQINPVERCGIAGANGSGKTTLLNILTGDSELSDATVAVRRSRRLGVLRQDRFVYEDQAILNVTLMGNRELWEAMVEKARVLAGAPDVLLLDEPTNHLDILSIRWLEKFLQDFTGTVAVVSHDHRFLDNIATSILDVDYGTVTLYQGNYSAFVQQKVDDRERRDKQIQGRQKQIARHQEFVDRFKSKATKARQARSKLRMIEKKADELEELPGSSRRDPKFRFDPRRPSGREVVRITRTTTRISGVPSEQRSSGCGTSARTGIADSYAGTWG